MKTKFPWLKLLKKSDPDPVLELPLWMNSWSNGEVFVEQTARDRRIKKHIFELAEKNAKRVGVDRREFLTSAMGMATSLWVLGCSDDEGNPTSDAPKCYEFPKDAMLDESVACQALGGDEFIFDIQTHHYVEGDWTKTNPQYKLFFDAVNWYDLDRDQYIQRLYIESDTSVTVLSGLPSAECSETLKVGCGLPISNEEIANSRDIINRMANSVRLLNHSMVTPNTELKHQLEIMEHNKCTLGVAGWKLYPGYFGTIGHGYFLDEDMGIAVIEKGISLGVPIFCIHKGLPIGNFFDTEHNKPRDVGIVAKRYPDAHFIIYHSAICAGIPNTNCPEGPYDPADQNPTGTNQLIRSLLENDVQPNSNVYAELGTAFGMATRMPDGGVEHFIGKLLKYVGENNVLWGSDAMNGIGSPQPLIETFRNLTIRDEFITDHEYPQLTPEIKRKVLGLNSARVFGLDPNATRCALANEPTAKLKRELDGEYGGRRWTLLRPPGPTTRRDFMAFRKSLNGMPG
jgi:uncharacterized protein